MIRQLALFLFLLLLCATNSLSGGLQVKGSKEVLGRHLHIVLVLIKIRIVVAPLVIVLFGDFTRLQHGSGLLPGTEHLMQPGGVLVLPYIDYQADFPIHLADLEPVVILQGKQGVHEPRIGVYIRDEEGMRTFPESPAPCRDTSMSSSEEGRKKWIRWPIVILHIISCLSITVAEPLRNVKVVRCICPCGAAGKI